MTQLNVDEGWPGPVDVVTFGQCIPSYYLVQPLPTNQEQHVAGSSLCGHPVLQEGMDGGQHAQNQAKVERRREQKRKSAEKKRARQKLEMERLQAANRNLTAHKKHLKDEISKLLANVRYAECFLDAIRGMESSGGVKAEMSSSPPQTAPSSDKAGPGSVVASLSLSSSSSLFSTVSKSTTGAVPQENVLALSSAQLTPVDAGPLAAPGICQTDLASFYRIPVSPSVASSPSAPSYMGAYPDFLGTAQSHAYMGDNLLDILGDLTAQQKSQFGTDVTINTMKVVAQAPVTKYYSGMDAEHQYLEGLNPKAELGDDPNWGFSSLLPDDLLQRAPIPSLGDCADSPEGGEAYVPLQDGIQSGHSYDPFQDDARLFPWFTTGTNST